MSLLSHSLGAMSWGWVPFWRCSRGRLTFCDRCGISMFRYKGSRGSRRFSGSGKNKCSGHTSSQRELLHCLKPLLVACWRRFPHICLYNSHHLFPFRGGNHPGWTFSCQPNEVSVRVSVLQQVSLGFRCWSPSQIRPEETQTCSDSRHVKWANGLCLSYLLGKFFLEEDKKQIRPYFPGSTNSEQA